MPVLRVPAFARSLRFFLTAEGNHIIVKVGKERPEVVVAWKTLKFFKGDEILHINCADGCIVIGLATQNCESQFYVYDSDPRSLEVLDKNLIVNHEEGGRINILSTNPLDYPDEKKYSHVLYSVKVYHARANVALDMVRAAALVAPGGSLFVLSHKKLGAKPQMYKLQEWFGENNVVIIARGGAGVRIIQVQDPAANLIATDSPDEGFAPVEYELLGRTFKVEILPSVFSKKGLDKGTRFLLETVDLTQFRNMLDFGCGWGAIGIAAATLNPSGRIVMTDIDPLATKAASRNTQSLGFSYVSVESIEDYGNSRAQFDFILSNPPFHAPIAELIDIFKDLRDHLAKNGTMSLVIEKSFVSKFEVVLEHVFGRYSQIANNGDYSILQIQK